MPPLSPVYIHPSSDDDSPVSDKTYSPATPSSYKTHLDYLGTRHKSLRFSGAAAVYPPRAFLSFSVISSYEERALKPIYHDRTAHASGWCKLTRVTTLNAHML